MNSIEEKLKSLETKINISSTSSKLKKGVLSLIISVLISYIYKPNYLYETNIKNKKPVKVLRKDKLAIFLVVHSVLVFLILNVINKYI
jgi:hypothetical protein